MILVSYEFTNQSTVAAALAPTSVAPHLSAGAFFVSDGSFTSTSFTTGSPPAAPAVSDSGSWNALTPAKYFAFTLAPDPGYEFEITGIAFSYRQTSTGAANYQVDVGAIANVASGTFLTDSVWHTATANLEVSDAVSAQEIRIYGYNGGAGSFGIDSITLAGNVSAVPEPGAFGAAAGAAVLLGAMLRRRSPFRSKMSGWYRRRIAGVRPPGGVIFRA